METNHYRSEPILVDNVVKETATFNGGELIWLFNATENVEKEWERRITCSLCYTKRFFLDNGVDINSIPYKIYINSSFTEVKSLLYEITRGKFHLQPNAGGAVTNGVLFTEQKTNPSMDVHEYIHILMDNLQNIRNQGGKLAEFSLPMWFREGLPQYIQGKKGDINYFDLARALPQLPPIILDAMNNATEKFWMEFGIMDQYIITGNHPGLTACASFVQFLIEKEKIDFKTFWNLIYFEGELVDFYRKVEEIAGNKLYNILNNYLYYIDKPFFSMGQKFWEMPVAVARDFRGEFAFENKKFEVLKLFNA